MFEAASRAASATAVVLIDRVRDLVPQAVEGDAFGSVRILNEAILSRMMCVC